MNPPNNFTIKTTEPSLGACEKRHFLARQARQPGFALIVTLSLMILLTVIAVGLLSLSSVSLRTSGQNSAQQQARADARLALTLALGELQTQMGPDQRISANAGILDPNTPSKMENSQWLGAWNSWYAGRTTGMRPDELTGGDDPSEHRTIGTTTTGMSPKYTKNREKHFRSWLVSLLLPKDSKDIAAASRINLSSATTSPTKDSTAVQLVGKGSLGASATTGFVNAQLIPRLKPGSTSPSGRFAWWVGDESQKARIMGDSYALSGTLTKADKIFRHQAPGSTGTNSVPGLETVNKTDGSSNADQRKLTYVPSLKSLGLLNAGSKEVPAKNFHHITPYSCQVLSDVREGGLKRDLSTLLERPISTSETAADFKLYQLGSESVPIQDLAAYYQLYRYKGTLYTSNVLRKGIQTTTPDFNSSSTFMSEYSNLYRMPVPIRVQFELKLIAVPRDPAPPTTPRVVNQDTHKLNIGIAPAVTLWNPYNVPLIMNYGNANTQSTLFRMFNLPLSIKFKKKDSSGATLIQTTGVTLGDIVGQGNNAFSMFFSGTRSIAFQPGEVKVFSLNSTGLSEFPSTDVYDAAYEVVPDWKPTVFVKMPRSATRQQFADDRPPRVPPAPRTTESKNFDQTGSDYSLTFKNTDTLSVQIEAVDNANPFGQAAFEFFLRQSALKNSPGTDAMSRQFQMNSQKGSNQAGFNVSLISKGFPGGASVIPFGSDIPVQPLIRKGPLDGNAFLQFSLAAAAESNNPDGTQYASRPFLHSSAITGSAIIDKLDSKSLYLNGWNWMVKKVTSGFDALTQTSKTGQGFYGGGIKTTNGTTNVVQQEIPVVPPISIAALSHAQLGGFSIARKLLGTAPADYPNNFKDTTASGNGGLFPRTLQAIGNSYAHPFLDPNKATGTFSREIVAGNSKSVDFADHSYLANKALWDDYFFSSITPANTEIFEGSSSAAQVANNFFFNDKPLPNRRMVPYLNNFDENDLKTLQTSYNNTADGFADQIASHMMVQGAFNVNSTSIDAWKTFLNSLKFKTVVYLGMSRSLTDGGILYPDDPKDPTPGVPVSFSTLPNYRSYQGSPTDTANVNSWAGWRLLTDKEINELATAIVKQVKLRGPFLSLSEFVNRRLDSSNKDLSLKGALQAALDDPSVSINSAFRTSRPKITSSQVSGTAFPEALEGPVAYGSAAYVDQADVLRNCAELLAPRGDTFVIRTYADALDASGNIQARAWCEAVVQRVPEYIVPDDLPYRKWADITGISKTFGRKLQIVSMRYLSKDEI